MAVAYNLTNSKGITLKESSATGRTNYSGTSGSETIYGTDGANYFAATNGADTLIGGKGDDIYCVSAGDLVIEQGGEGIDTVFSYISDYTLTANVENLTVSSKDAYGGGNDLDNFIKGGAERQILDGGAGNDVLMGGTGADTFIVRKGNGSDVINDFSASEGDLIRLDGYGYYDFDQVQKGMTQVGNDTLLQLSATETLTLKNTKISDLTQASFFLPEDLSGLKLTFSDEFNNLSLWDATSNTGTWRTVLGYGGPNSVGNRTLQSNGELQIYMDADFAGTGKTALGVNPFSLNDGVLTITATETTQAVSDSIWGYDYTSGLITSRFSFAQQYGYFEMRADLPDAQGVWPAFWLLPADGSWPPELDIFEGLGNDDVVFMSSHTKETGKHTYDTNQVHVYDSADGFHTYGVKWTAETLTWYIDGVAVKQTETPADMHKPMYILANMAVGGWAGAPEDDLNAQMKIDYIKVYSLEQATTPQIPTTPTDPVTPQPEQKDDVVTLPPTPPVVENKATATTFTDTAANNIFTLKSADDIFTGPGGGVDTVNSVFSWTLKAGLENLNLTGSGNLTGTGNTADNRMIGNEGASTLLGLDGNDTLIAGSGVTTMKGGIGNDLYQVNKSTDIVIELAGEGIDSIQASVSFTLTDNVENMSLTGTNHIDGIGNSLDNRIIGNDGDNMLKGMGGNDNLIGGKGSDQLWGGTGADLFTFKASEGHDIIWDFSAAEKDKIDLSALKAKSTAVMAQVGDDVLITFSDGHSLTVMDQSVTDKAFLAQIVW